MSGDVGADVVLEDLQRRYGEVRALDGLRLDLAAGELLVLLGPSGCGKTTALRALAGLEDLDGGRVLVGGRDVTRVPANRRDMGMVFQAYSLFPHLTASQNVEFGLRLRGEGAAARRRRAGEVLELVGLADQAGRYASQLSGGQQQRVALARALAIRPSVLLLDEPLSALDAKVRTALREEVRRIQLEVGTTTLFVTHDQEEALAVADRVGVMRAGRLEQVGPPEEVYARPATAFVAEFVGLTNQLPGVVAGGAVEVLGGRLPLVDPRAPAGRTTAYVRPEDVELVPGDGGQSDGVGGGVGGGVGARVVTTSFLGALRRTTVALPDGTLLVAQHGADAHAGLRPGSPVDVRLRPTPVVVAGAEVA